jgi:hypothetical protein
MPEGITPHLGSQWWCLTRQTLSAILEDPNGGGARPISSRSGSRTKAITRRWSGSIPPDRKPVADPVEVRFSGQAAHLLRRPPASSAPVGLLCRAQDLAGPTGSMHGFLTVRNDAATVITGPNPNPGKIDRVFSKALERRTPRGGPGFTCIAGFPIPGWENGLTVGALLGVRRASTTCSRISRTGFARRRGTRVHGHLFAMPRPRRFSGGSRCLCRRVERQPDPAGLQPAAFLTNLIWNTRGERQCFQFGPATTRRSASWPRTPMRKSRSSRGLGRAAVLFEPPISPTSAEAARLQKIGGRVHLNPALDPQPRRDIRIWTMADFVENPMENLQGILDAIGKVRPFND